MEYRQIIDRITDKGPQYIGRHACFSVLVPFVETEKGQEILFEVRSAKIKRQPGEICFPGGMKEPGETDLQCAVRETSEELGIAPEDIRVDAEIGTMNTYGGYVIKVYAGRIDYRVLERARYSRTEVAELFTVPAGFFLEEEPLVYYGTISETVGEDFPYELVGFPDGYPWKSVQGEIPIYVYGKYTIWGITGRILKYLAETVKEGMEDD